MNVRLTHVNQGTHLDGVVSPGALLYPSVGHAVFSGQKRQHGGIGSSAHDPAQSDIRAFFGGKVVSSKEEKENVTENVPDEIKDGSDELEEGRARSNAVDEEIIPPEER